jgi:hypothetical protein
LELWGNLKDFSLPDVIQLVGFGRKTGVLSVEHGSIGSMLYFKDGNVVHAESGLVEGEDAVFQLFRCTAGEFRFRTDIRPSRQTIFMDPTNLVMEAARLLDEAVRDAEGEQTAPAEAAVPEEAAPAEEVVSVEEAAQEFAEEETPAEAAVEEAVVEEIEIEEVAVEEAAQKQHLPTKADLEAALEASCPAVAPTMAEAPMVERKASPGELRDEIKALLESKFGRDAKRLMQAVEKCGDTYDDFQELATRVERFISAFVDPKSAKAVGVDLRELINRLPDAP